MKNNKETFASIIAAFSYRYEPRSVFNDFLTMSMCAVSQIPMAGKSHYEDLYMKTIATYANDNLRHQFPRLFAQLVLEMDDRVDSSSGNDVVGEYYEQNFCRKNSGQFFTPWPICQFMAQTTCGALSEKKIQSVIDPCCGSGRMLMAGAKVLGPSQEFYGIDIDHTCVQMCALNLFLNGIFHAEVMCADALLPDDFKVSYVTSLLPFGIFRIEEKEKSKLWQRYKHSLSRNPRNNIMLPSEDKDSPHKGSQLHLF